MSIPAEIIAALIGGIVVLIGQHFMKRKNDAEIAGIDVDTFGKMRIGTAGTLGISGDGALANDTIKVNYTLTTSTGAGNYSCNFINWIVSFKNINNYSNCKIYI